MSQPDQSKRFALHRLVHSRRWLVFPPLLVGLGVIIALATSQDELPRKSVEQVALPVRVVEARRTPIRSTATGYGTVRARRVWSAIAEVGGRVVELREPLRSGEFVAQSTRLVKIDPADYELLQTQRDAELKQAEAELRQLTLNEVADRESLKIQKELKDVRRAEVDRLKSLNLSSAASVSERDAALSLLLTQSQAVQDLESGLLLYEARKQAATARIESAKAKLREADRDLERTEIRAPMAGLVSEADLEVGQYVSPNEMLFQLLDVSTVEIEAQFSLAQLLRLFPRRGNSPQLLGVAGGRTEELSSLLSARVIVRSGDSVLEYPATPVRIVEQVDSQTRTLGMVVEVTNAAYASVESARDPTTIALRPGTFCEVVLESRHELDGVLLQRTAIEGGVAYVVEQSDEDVGQAAAGTDMVVGRIRRRPVETWKIAGSKVAVRSGLADGELVIVNPPFAPAEGLLVSPILDDTTAVGDAAGDDEPIARSTSERVDDGKDVQR